MKVAVITSEKITKKFAGIKFTVFGWENSSPDNINLRDFDGVIVDIDSYAKLEDKTSVDVQGFETKVFSPKIVSDVLTEEGSFFVVLGKPNEFLDSRPLSTTLGFTLNEIEGSGDSISESRWAKSTVYAKYLGKINKYAYSFELVSKLNDYYSRAYKKSGSSYGIAAALTPLLITRAKYCVAFTITPMTYHIDPRGYTSDNVDIFKGPLAFLPVLPSGNKQSIEAILEKYSSDIPTEAPDWVEKIKAVGQDEIDQAIKATKETITKAQAELEEALNRRSSARKQIELLYLSDKPLENALKMAFELAGYDVRDPANANNVEFYLKHDSREFVTEVKSTEKATFNKEGMRQVNEWRENELLDTGKDYKPLLILSNEYLTEPTKRNLEFIDENLVAFAKSRKIAVISVGTLYEAFQMIKEGNINTDNLSELLHESSGIITVNMVKSLLEKASIPIELEKDERKDNE